MDFVEFSFSVFFLQPFWKLAKLYKIACTYEQGTGKTIIFPKENMQNSQMGGEIFFKQNLIILCTQLTDGSHSARFSTFSEGMSWQGDGCSRYRKRTLFQRLSATKKT